MFTLAHPKTLFPSLGLVVRSVYSVCVVWCVSGREGGGEVERKAQQKANLERTTQKSPLNSSEILSKYIKLFFTASPLFLSCGEIQTEKFSPVSIPHTCGEKRHGASVCSSLPPPPPPHCALRSSAHHSLHAGRTSCYGLWM